MKMLGLFDFNFYTTIVCQSSKIKPLKYCQAKDLFIDLK